MNTNEKIDIYDLLNNKGKLKKKSILKEKKENKMKEIKFENLRKKNKKYNSKYIYENKEEIKIETEIEKNREKKKERIRSLIDNIDYQNEISFLNKYIRKYNEELVDYIYVKGNNIKNINIGGYIRYITLEGELRYGGILIAFERKERYDKMRLVLKNSENKRWKIKFNKYYIFYKNHTTLNDKFRKIFITSMKK